MNMLQIAVANGTTDIFLTSHGRYVLQKPEIVKNGFEELTKRAAKEFPQIKLYMGCEVLCEYGRDVKSSIRLLKPTVRALKKGKLPTYNGTKFFLLEFWPMVLPEQALAAVKLLKKRGFNPVLAHVERYRNISMCDAVDRLVEQGALIQIHARSLVDELIDEKYCQASRFLLEKRLVHFIGSDAHNIYSRAPKMRQGIEYIWKTYDEEYAREICYKNAEMYLGV